MTITTSITVDGSSAVTAHAVAFGIPVTLGLTSTVGVSTCTYDFPGASRADAPELTVAYGGTVGAATFSISGSGISDGAGCSYILRATLNGGLTNGRPDPSLIKTVVLGVPNAFGVVPPSAQETTERDATIGWTYAFNQLIGAAAMAGADKLESVRYAVAESALTSGMSTVITSSMADGVTPTAGDEILIYGDVQSANQGTWVLNASKVPDTRRATDEGLLFGGTEVYVREGTAQGKKVFRQTRDAAVNFGEPMRWTRTDFLGGVEADGFAYARIRNAGDTADLPVIAVNPTTGEVRSYADDTYANAIQFAKPSGLWWSDSSLSGLTANKVFSARETGSDVGALAAWDDLVGGTDATQATAGKRPSLTWDGWAVDGSAAVAFWHAAISTLDTNDMFAGLADGNAWTLSMVMSPRNDSTDRILFGWHGAGSSFGQVYLNAGNTVNMLRRDTAGTVTQTPSLAMATDVPTTMTIVHNGANSSITVGATRAAAPAIGATAMTYTAAKIGASTSEGFPASMWLRGMSLFRGAATDAQARKISRMLAGHTFPRVVVDGNSMSVPGAWPALLTNYVKGATVESYAIGGQSTFEMNGRYIANVRPRYTAIVPTVLVAWEITNDIYAGRDLATVMTRFWQYCDTARDDGFPVVTLTVLPRSTFDAAQELIRLAANRLIEANWQAHADVMIPIHRMGKWKDTNSTRYKDGTHPSDVEGNDDIARMVGYAILGLV